MEPRRAVANETTIGARATSEADRPAERTLRCARGDCQFRLTARAVVSACRRGRRQRRAPSWGSNTEKCS